jgi:putative hemolysin
MIIGTREIAYTLLLIVIILLSAFFAGSETALMRTNRYRIRTLAEKGNRDAKRVETILKEPDKLISTLLLGNNFANILGSSLATALFISVFGDKGILYASVAMTIILLIFSEITPKTIAAYRADEFSMITSSPVSLVIKVFSPVVHLLAMASRGLLALFRFKVGDAEKLTEEDVESVITMGHKEGFIQEPKAKMLVAVMDMDTLPVKKVMMPLNDMEFVSVDSSFDDIVEVITTRNHSRYPIYEGERENILGYIHIRDMWRYQDKRDSFKVSDILREAYFIPETKSILKQLIDFQKKRLHMSFIVDEYGTVKGGITLEDIIEEITGDIIDEHDVILAHVIPVGERSYIVSGHISLRDLGKFINREFPEEYDTLSGLIYELLDRIPEEGDKVVWQDMEFRIERMRGNRVSRVRITLRKEEPQSRS